MTSDKLRKDIEQADIFQLVFEAGSQAYCVSPNTKKIVDVELIKTIAELAKIKLTTYIDQRISELKGGKE